MYLLEGNIGVGKSTFLSLLQQWCPEIAVVEEPVNNWASFEYGQSLLANFYNDTPRWAYTLETFAMISRVREHVIEQQYANKSRLMERSIYSGYYCFARNSFEQGFMMQLEWSLQQQWFDFLVTKNCLPPIGFIYLRATPSVCLERTKQRNRKGEEGISISYLEQIDRLHESFLVEKRDIAPNLVSTPVLILDANRDFVADEKSMQEHAQRVQKFLHETQRTIRPSTSAHMPS